MKAFNHEKINEISIFYFSHELTITGSNSSNVFIFHDIFYDIVFVAKTLFEKQQVIKYVRTIYYGYTPRFGITIYVMVIELL